MSQQETIELFRYEKLRSAIAHALVELSPLILHEETGNYLEKHDVYHKLVQANAILSQGLFEGTQP